MCAAPRGQPGLLSVRDWRRREAEGGYKSAVYALMGDAIRDELHIMSMSEVFRTSTGDVIALPDEVLDQLAWSVATRLDYAFSFRWVPDWVGPGEPHVWSEEAAFLARCNACLAQSGAMESEAAVRTWHREHQSALT